MSLSGDDLDPTKYAAANSELLELIVSEGDKRLQAQVQLMLAADQRANGILAATITLAAGGIGFAIAELDASPEPFVYAAFVFGLIEAMAALFSLTALWPEEIRPNGWAPGKFRNDLNKSKGLVQAEIAKFTQQRILKNRECAAKLSRRIQWAMLFAVEGPLGGLCVGLYAADRTSAAVCSAIVAAAIFAFYGVPLLPGSAKRR